ncbi:hypothetical protein NDU88_000640 [Pleurodeles waltl]|uniref:Uncharacterized protein n=1 Tax=Pleurodeles waltl TaxID=8319 RepID=A0AAV7NB14_PLEWA|nr:hypothetical protein NDU88_000640 [Pleurodeles waltl]
MLRDASEDCFRVRGLQEKTDYAKRRENATEKKNTCGVPETETTETDGSKASRGTDRTGAVTTSGEEARTRETRHDPGGSWLSKAPVDGNQVGDTQSLRRRVVVDNAHGSHQGFFVMIKFLYEKFGFPALAALVDAKIQIWHMCHNDGKNPQSENLITFEMLDSLWPLVALDIYDPLN